MVQTVKSGHLDALLGLTFDSAGLVTTAASRVDGTITNTTGSAVQVLTYNGLTATAGATFINQPMVHYTVTAISDATNALTISVMMGQSLVATLDFTVCGFNAAGIGLSAIPVAAMVSVASDLGQLTGSLFMLGNGVTQATGQSLLFSPGDAYVFAPGAQVMMGTAKGDGLHGTSGTQTLIGMAGDDTITAGSGPSLLSGGPGNDILIAGAGNDTLYGGAGSDTLRGGSGKANLYGGPGADRLEAGTGRALLYGGGGADTFVFAPGHTGGTRTTGADLIQDFSHTQGDHIDLTAFDAVLPAGGPSHLTFIGTAKFDHGAGEVRYDVTSTGVTLYGDLNGDGKSDFTLVFAKIAGLTAGDFIL